MKAAGRFLIVAAMILTLAACGEDPNNKFGGPSNNPRDTAASRRDTSSVGYRTDGRN
jgi:hypothetical protein